ncbi:Membrane protein PTM1 [Spathaspora sp. JA1]|nr:Membrane protein PTM1 [Spathaspora sp. JA1]
MLPTHQMKYTLFLLFASTILANLAKFDDDRYSQICAGVYSKHDWGGSIKPHIGLTLNQFNKNKYDPKNKDKKPDGDITVSYIIFEYKDLPNIGVDIGNGKYQYVCTDDAVKTKICDESQKGKFIVNSQAALNSTILSSQLKNLGAADIHYPINRTGYYCVSTFTPDRKSKYQGLINFQNAFGQLSASEIPKLPGYGILTLCYAIALALFGFQFFKKRKENQILPLQRYLLAMLGFLTFDTFVVWSYFDLVNRISSPSSAFARFYMFFLALLNSIKITFSFFLLLCIALGYGVVVLKLDKKTMLKCKILAGCNFVASFVYLIFSYYDGSSASLVTTDNIDTSQTGSALGLLPLIPVSITLCIYYVVTLSTIRTTTQNLHQQRQIIKLKLYQNLFRIIFGSVILTFAGLTISSFIYLSMSTTEMFEQHWKGSFFIFDFWPSVVFFLVFMAVAYLWRPTETSYMLAISQQLSTGEDINDDIEAGQPNYNQGHEFELDDLSLLSHSDDEEQARRNVERDSFELAADNQPPQPPSKKDVDAPPAYEQTSSDIENPFADSNEDVSQGNTLFELGDEEENESDHDKDERLPKSDRHKE